MNSPPFSPGVLPQQQGTIGVDPPVTRRAQDFVRQVAQLQYGFRHAVNLVASEGDMTTLAERFLRKQGEFRSAYKPVAVEIAYHYTRFKFLDSIGERGLMRSPGKQRHGRVFGAGVYVGNNPHAFMSYGDVGLVCLIVKGEMKQMYSGSDDISDSTDSLQGNKRSQKRSGGATNVRSPYFDETILRTDAQVLPLLWYQRELVNRTELLWDIQRTLQQSVDHFFNDGRPTFCKRILPDFRDVQYEHELNDLRLGSIPFQVSSKLKAQFASLTQSHFWNRSKAQGHMPSPKKAVTLDVTRCTPSSWSSGASQQQSYSILFDPFDKRDCPICLCLLKESRAVTINKCNHAFHENCLERSLTTSGNKCPVCRSVLGEPFGTCPLGTMTTVRRTDMHCRGFETVATLCLEYDVPNGTQTVLHDNPGRAFTGTKRKAYLPDVAEGRDLLKRLRYAFSRGLTFTVGTSLTSGRSDVVCWTSIHHKTLLSGGPHGWPDPGYFLNCNEELDAVNVPKACDLPNL